jgi:hypothetical protein
MWKCGLDSAGSGQWEVVVSCESGKEPLGSIKCKEFDLNEILLATQRLCSMELVHWSWWLNSAVKWQKTSYYSVTSGNFNITWFIV